MANFNFVYARSNKLIYFTHTVRAIIVVLYYAFDTQTIWLGNLPCELANRNLKSTMWH